MLNAAAAGGDDDDDDEYRQTGTIHTPIEY